MKERKRINEKVREEIIIYNTKTTKIDISRRRDEEKKKKKITVRSLYKGNGERGEMMNWVNLSQNSRSRMACVRVCELCF